MDTREKLIELLDGVMCAVIAPKDYGPIADELIANGVVAPVHCKDCKFWADGVAGCTDHVKVCKIGFYMIGENGYCVFGERKEGGV